MGKIIKIGIISDLHCEYSPDYRSQDTILFSNTLKNGNRKNQVQELLDYINTESLYCDYLLCPGDITNKMDIQGLISGFVFLKEIQTALKSKELICIPGNHDLDYCRLKTSLFAKANDPLKHLDADRYPLSDKSLSKMLLDDGYCVYKDDNIAILCINSVANFTDPKSAERVTIPETILKKIEEELKKIPKQISARIALTHHHPNLYTDLNFRMYGGGDFIENGDQLISLIKKYNFGLLIHGHKHKARLSSTDTLSLFCAGGFSALQNLQLGDDENTFHIIEIDSDYPMKGIVRTWSYSQSAGWKKPSQRFPHITGFGSTLSPSELAKHIGHFFQEEFKYEKQIIPYSVVISKFPEVLYLHHYETESLHKELKKYNCTFSRSDDQDYLLYQPQVS